MQACGLTGTKSDTLRVASRMGLSSMADMVPSKALPRARLSTAVTRLPLGSMAMSH